jgi:Tfp pilus assembly protein PilX
MYAEPQAVAPNDRAVHSRGAALVVSLVLLSLLVMLGASLLALSGLENNISHNDLWAEGALQAAEAGLHMGIDQLGVDPVAAVAAIPQSPLNEEYGYRSGSRLASGPEPLEFLRSDRQPGYGIAVGTGYNSAGYLFNLYRVNATGNGPRNARREVEAMAYYGPFPE